MGPDPRTGMSRRLKKNRIKRERRSEIRRLLFPLLSCARPEQDGGPAMAASTRCSPRGHARRRAGVEGDAESLGMLRTDAVLVEELRNSGNVEDGRDGTRWQQLLRGS